MAKSSGSRSARQANSRLHAELIKYHKAELAAHRAALKAYRHDLATLKSKGLLRKNTNVRTQKYTKSMLANIERYKDVLSGKAKVHTIKNKNIRHYYKDNPSEFIKPGLGKKVVVTNEAEYKSVVKQGFIQYVRKLKQGERVKVKIPIRDLYETIANVNENPILYEALKNPVDMWTFNFYGNHGRADSDHLSGLLYFLTTYQAFEDDDGTAANHLEIIRTTKDTQLSVPRDEAFFRNRKRIRRQRFAEQITASEKERQLKMRRDRYARYSINNAAKHEQYLAKQRARMERLRSKKK